MARPPHAFPVWELEVEDDDPEDSTAVLLLTAALFIGVFVLFFIVLPAMAS